MHALILLSVATLMLEFARAMAPGAEGDAAAPARSRLRQLLAARRPALRSALVHPVVLPIIAGVAWSLLHLGLPGPIDAALKLMASAATPMCLVLLGASLAQYGVSAGWGSVAALSALKNLLHPLLAYVAGRWLFGLDTLTLSVLTIAAGLPIGANVYLLAQRYRVELPIVSGAVSLSTVVGGVTLPILLAWLR
jgi:malonate transporter